MKPLMPREDIQPVILGGDWSTYALAREFYEAFGVTSRVIWPGVVAVIKYSRFIEHVVVETAGEDDVLAAVKRIAADAADKTVVLIANTDDRVRTVEAICGRLPENVVYQLSPHELVDRVSDKVSFQRMCAEYGLDVPKTEVVSLAGDEPIAASEVGFPLVAKPAVSSEYAHLYPKGFQKVYFMHEQAELDKLWSDLRAEGFGGEFLVQELIEGDDNYMDSITMYVDSEGEIALRSAAHVILEDHVPALYGNPVAMITKPVPELWDKVGAMLKGIGWRGFANIDLKRDPKTGRAIFMDFNPRIGANSYYSCAAGVNPMYVLVRDIVDGVHDESHSIEKNVLYKRVPVSLARRYVTDPELLELFDRVVGEGAIANPTRCPDDTLGSRFNGMLMERNYIRKFKRYYPKPTETSF